MTCRRCGHALVERIGPDGPYWWTEAEDDPGHRGSDCLWTDGRSMAPHEPTDQEPT